MLSEQKSRPKRCAWHEFAARTVAIAILAHVTIVGLASTSLADVGACRDTAPPRSESEALDRAGFAFDGVVVGGRPLVDATGGKVLVSPLRFRVIRPIKGNLADYESGSSGSLIITVWDAAYASRNLKQRVLHDRGPDHPLSGEIAVSAGDRWRIYALSQVGNWTAKICLGSHPLGEVGAQVHSGTKFLVPWVWWLLGLAGAGVILMGWRLLSSRRRRARPGI